MSPGLKFLSQITVPLAVAPSMICVTSRPRLVLRNLGAPYLIFLMMALMRRERPCGGEILEISRLNLSANELCQSNGTLRTYNLKKKSLTSLYCTSIYITPDLRVRSLANAGMCETASYHRKGCLHIPGEEQERQMDSCCE